MSDDERTNLEQSVNNVHRHRHGNDARDEAHLIDHEAGSYISSSSAVTAVTYCALANTVDGNLGYVFVLKWPLFPLGSKSYTQSLELRSKDLSFTRFLKTYFI